MRNLLHCRRGASAFVTVIALVPLIGVVSIGAEAGSWYVTKQHAQNAADAAAYSGALRLACSLGATACTDASSVDYRGKEFAAQNAFCNAGDTTAYPGSKCSTSLPTGVSQAVSIAIGSYSPGAWTTTASGHYVRAVVSQTQPAYLAAVLGLKTVNVGAQAIALVEDAQPICSLGLGNYTGSGSPANSLTLGGSVSSTGAGCALMSDNTVKYNSTPTFSGSGWAVDAVTGCNASAGTCSNPGVPYNYYTPYANNPLSALNSETSLNSITGNASTCKFNANSTSCTLASNATGPAYGANISVSNGDTLTFASGGTFIFYNSTINITGGTVTGTNINIVLLGNSSLSISGGNVSLSANMNNTTYPFLDGVLIDDQAPNKSNNAIIINGGGTVALGGAVYAPYVDVTWNGTIQNTNTTCSEVVANSITMTGTAYMSTSGCAAGTVATTQVVALVQ
jgi:Flp pilus assembly protein TadG